MTLFMTCLVGTVLASSTEKANDNILSALPETPEGLVILQHQIISQTQNNTVTLTM